jgi:c-di-GMP-binding flagellar brake protein YcgR
MKQLEYIINSKIEIVVGDEAYTSKVQDSTERYIAITIPGKRGQYYTPPVGEILELLYYDSNNMYRLQGAVIGRRTENAVAQIIIAVPQIISKIQRRQFVRVPVSYYIKYEKCYLNNSNDNASLTLDEKLTKKGIMLDISGGGLRLKVMENIALGEIIVAEIPSEKDGIKVMGEVIRVEKDEEGKNICGISFIDITEKTRENIIEYIFTLMRKQRKTL